MKVTKGSITRHILSFNEERDEDGQPLCSSGEGDTNEELIRSFAAATGKALERLTQRQRAAIVLHYFQGLSQRQIAKLWEVSPSAVSRVMKRAIGKLRELIVVN